MCTGYPNRLRTDQGSVFKSHCCSQPANLNGVQIRLYGIKAHSSLVIGEKLHDPLRRIFKRNQNDYPHISPNFILKIAVESVNDTMGENGLVP